MKAETVLRDLVKAQLEVGDLLVSRLPGAVRVRVEAARRRFASAVVAVAQEYAGLAEEETRATGARKVDIE